MCCILRLELIAAAIEKMVGANLAIDSTIYRKIIIIIIVIIIIII